jgi:uncharacterized membrane protein (DUF4010 family)
MWRPRSNSAIVTLIILPLVPNVNYGPPPLDAVNPYKIWLMVVLISALNFASYLVIKVVGPEHGIGLVGLLGGLASSTAVTLGLCAAQPSRTGADALGAGAWASVLAWTVMLLRVAIMTALLSWELGQQLFALLGCAVRGQPAGGGLAVAASASARCVVRSSPAATRSS